MSYGGGCREHAFQLLVGDGFRESDPVQATALVSHDAHGATRGVDIIPLRENLASALDPAVPISLRYGA